MNEFDKWLQKFQHLCSKKEYCCSELLEKLDKTMLTKLEKQKLIDSLKKDGYVNEERYIQAFVHDKLKLNKWGKQKIRYALLSKKLDEKLVDKILNEVMSEQEYIHLFLPIARTKWTSIKADNEFSKKNKLIQYLRQKGLEYSIIEKILDKL